MRMSPMRTDGGKWADIGEGICYLAVAIAILATYREPIRESLRDIRNWYNLKYPSGRMFREAREAANKPLKGE